MTMMPDDQNPMGGGLLGYNPAGGGGLNNLVSNPLFMAGLGLLSAGRDRRIDPFQSAAQGLLSANQIQQAQADADMRRQQFGMQQRKFDYEQQQQRQQQDDRTKVQGLLAEGKTEEAARTAIASGDPALSHWAAGLLTPQKPASIQELEYLQQHPELQGQFEKLQAMGRPQTPYFTPLPSSDGYLTFDNRTGKILPILDSSGKPLLPIAADVDLSGKKSAAEAAGTTTGKGVAEAAFSLPGVIASGQQTLNLIDQALQHPGLGTATGFQGAADPRNYIPGTDAKNFQVLLDQLKGKTFLEAYQGLKGAGAITEVEGKKAEDAIARLNRSQSTDAFKASLTDLRDVVNAGLIRSQMKASQAQQMGIPSMATPAAASAPAQPMQSTPQASTGWGIQEIK